jgi:peptidoglycan/LPS O-acetylase OafA/YrhL
VASHAPPRYRELDALRGIAAFAVMLFHFNLDAKNTLGPQLWTPLAYGKYGVQLFFIISGFVILLTARRCVTVKQFAVSRFSRLYPAYWAACVLIFSLLALNGQKPSWTNALGNPPMFQIHGVERLEGVFWTLQQELWFYIVIAGLIFVRRLNFALLTVAALVVTSLAGLRFTAWFSLFLIGMVLFDSLKGFRPIHYALLALAAADILCRSLVYQTHGVDTPVYPVIILLSAALVLLATRVRVPVLTNPVLLFLGTISYSLYLVHATIGRVIITRLVPQGVNLYAAALIAGVASIATATAFAFLIERPAMKLLRPNRS